MSEPVVRSVSWKIRRRIITAILVFCGAGIVYLLAYGLDTRLNETIASGLLLLAGSTVGSYLFGATWDDKGKK